MFEKPGVKYLKDAEIAALEHDLEQLYRAAENPNLAPSQQGSKENEALTKRIAEKHSKLEELRSEVNNG